MGSITAQAPDGASLNIDIPAGSDPSKYDDIVHDAVGHYMSEKQSPLESAARGALRNFPLAQQAVAGYSGLYNKLGLPTPDYGQAMQSMTQGAEQGKAQNPKSYYAGAALGTILPSVVMPEAAGAAMLGSKVAAAGGGAALGAAQSLSDTNLTQNPEQIAKTAAVGGALGAAGGLAGYWMGNKMVTPSEASAEATEHMIQLPARQAATILGKDPEKGLNEIGQTIRDTVVDGKPLAQLSDSPMRFAGKVREAVNNYGKQISEVVNPLSDTKLSVDPILDGVDKLSVGEHGLKVESATLNKIKQIITDNADKDGTLTFGKLRDVLKKTWDMIEIDPQTQRLLPESKDAMQAWKYFRNFEDEVVKRQAPEMLDKFTEASNNFSNLVGLQRGLNSVGLREAAKPTQVGGLLNPLSLATRIGKGAEQLTGLDKVARSGPFLAMPAINAVRGVIPNTLFQNAAINFATSNVGEQGATYGVNPQTPQSINRQINNINNPLRSIK